MSDGSKPLIIHIVTHYQRFFPYLTYSSVFEGLRLRYQQLQEPVETEKAEEKNEIPNPVQQDGYANIDASESAYFETSDDEEEPDVKPPAEAEEKTAADKLSPVEVAQPFKHGLVNYPDDDENDDDGFIKVKPVRRGKKMTIALKSDALPQQEEIPPSSQKVKKPRSVS